MPTVSYLFRVFILTEEKTLALKQWIVSFVNLLTGGVYHYFKAKLIVDPSKILLLSYQKVQEKMNWIFTSGTLLL